MLRIIAGLLPAASGVADLEGANRGMADHAPLPAIILAMPTAMNGPRSRSRRPDFLAGIFSGNTRIWRSDEAPALGTLSRSSRQSGHLPPSSAPSSAPTPGQKRTCGDRPPAGKPSAVWLVDEPTAGLDKVSERGFEELMQVHLEEAGIIIAATHLPLETHRSTAAGDACRTSPARTSPYAELWLSRHAPRSLRRRSANLVIA